MMWITLQARGACQLILSGVARHFASRDTAKFSLSLKLDKLKLVMPEVYPVHTGNSSCLTIRFRVQNACRLPNKWQSISKTAGMQVFRIVITFLDVDGSQ